MRQASIGMIGNTVCIAVSCSNEYTPYLSVFMESICVHADAKRNYDVIVLERSINEKNKLKLFNQNKYKNIKLKFCDPSAYFTRGKLFVSRPSFKEECYYRIAAPLILSYYDKILFTDVDLVFTGDPARIFDIDMGKSPIAAIRDPMMAADSNRTYKTVFYLREILHMSDPSLYLNTGVMLISVPQYIKYDLFNRIFQHCLKNQFKLQEQDAINSLLASKVHPLPLEYNYTPYNQEWETLHLTDYMPPGVLEQYERAGMHPLIIHWAGETAKPWHFPGESMAVKWWWYAGRTVFYEEIVARFVDYTSSQRSVCIMSNVDQLRKELLNTHLPAIDKHFATEEHKAMLFWVMEHTMRCKMRRLILNIKKAFSFGDTHVNYLRKYDALTGLLKNARELKKKFLQTED